MMEKFKQARIKVTAANKAIAVSNCYIFRSNDRRVKQFDAWGRGSCQHSHYGLKTPSSTRLFIYKHLFQIHDTY